MKSVLVIGGFNCMLGDGSPIWDIADQLAALPGVTVTQRQWDQVGPQDVDQLEGPGSAIVCYSYGCAALWMALHQLPMKPSIEQLFIVAGVPRVWFDQWYGSVWTIPSCFSKATAFNVNSFPRSCPISNPSSVYTNIQCDGDVTQPDGHKADHANLPGDPRVVSAILAWAGS